jgi:PAS domain-containing protein
MRAFFAKESKDIVGRDDSTLFDAQTAQSAMDRDRQVISAGLSMQFEEAVTVGTTTRVFLTTKIPLRDDEGRIIGIVGVSRDTTDRKSALTALREAYQFTSEVISNAQEGIVVYDREGRCVV